MRQADVVVIGAGVSGLMATAFLAREGREVLVLEQGAAPGGCIGGFVRNGFAFDGGAQSFESLGLLLPLVGKLGRLERLDAERTSYRLRTPTVDCPLSQSYAEVEQAFCRAHPKAADGLHAFFGRVLPVSGAFERLAQPGRTPFLHQGAAQALRLGRIGLGSPGDALTLWRSHQHMQREVAERTIDDPGLRALLGSFGYRDGSLFAFGAFLACWRQDYWRPRQGMQQLADVLAEDCEAHGARLRYRTSVQEIVRSDGRVRGVRLSDGEQVLSSVVLAACDQSHLERELLGLETAEPEPEAVSDSFFTLFLGLDLEDRALDQLLPEHHTFLVPVHRDCRLDPSDPVAHAGRWLQISRSSRAGRGQAPDGASSVVVQTMTRADWADWWGRGPSGARTDRYRELKAEVEEQLLATLDQFVPELRPAITLRFSATPWTYRRYTGNLHGASAGWTWDPRRARVREKLGAELGVSSAVRTNVRGLYRCGHWTASPGSVPGSALSGWDAFRAICHDSG
jgi:phytoene dehydrogenase-like protein